MAANISCTFSRQPPVLLKALRYALQGNEPHWGLHCNQTEYTAVKLGELRKHTLGKDVMRGEVE